MNNDDRPGAETGDAAVDPVSVDAAEGTGSATAVLEAPIEDSEQSEQSVLGSLFAAVPPLRTEPEKLFPEAPEPALGGPLFPAESSASSREPVTAAALPAALPAALEEPSASPQEPAAGDTESETSEAAFAPAEAGSAPAAAGSAPAEAISVEAASAPATAGSRRHRRRTAADRTAGEGVVAYPSPTRGADPAPTRAADPGTAAALTWVDIERFAEEGAARTAGAAAPAPLLSDAPRRSLARPGVLVPIAGLVLVAVAYGATTAAWPLNAVKPTASAVAFQPAAAPAAAVTWPTSGSAAVSIQGIGTIASSEQPAPMASITKLVTVLASFDKLPMKPGEQGATFEFTQADSDDYWNYLRDDESALDVPAGGSLTQYQLLEGILLGSANNYADRLAHDVWGSDQDYATAANQWLRQHDLTDITVVTPSGFAFGNVSTPRALIQLGQLAVQNPVIAEIVRQKSVVLPGAGTVENTNGLIDDDGIIGIKTGTIGDGDDTKYNLLSAKDVPDGSSTVRIYADVLGETSDAGRVDASRKLYADVEAALKNQPQTVTKGTTLGTVDTAWGETTQVVAASDARVVLWNGASASATTRFALGDDWKAGDKAGTLTLKGPLDTATVPLALHTELQGPSLWWRLTHPLELFGLARK
ncbi:D-alanyl-D-alanine carboxypeptidase family protein [Microbacterium sp. 22242]|uniref:D-alanyl-D-alanine carboxypeptidase family protein n=1 Tax=Microbacterium sp. 22242 TaxID=3453896 RepID=UPI003F876437